MSAASIDMLFVGVDLAWSPKNRTSVAIIQGNGIEARLVHFNSNLGSDAEIIDYIKRSVGDRDAIVAIDAPLIVPNKKGRRIAEARVGELFRKYDAGAHPANRERLSQWGGKVRGEEISRLLEKDDFKHNPYIKKSQKARAFFEVYPHPSMVVLFDLDRILRYKAKPKKNYEFRWKEFERYQNHLKNLERKNPKLLLSNEIVRKNVRALKGNALKEYEDLLDSIFCAYIAYYSWLKPENCQVLGNMKQGYILTPVFDSMKK